MKRQSVINCMFSSWLSKYESITLPTKIISLPVSFIHYLNSDNVVLPSDGNVSYSNDLNGYSDNEEDTDSWSDGEVLTAPSFPDLKAEVEEAIKDLGGVVFPKLTWSAPRDACWMSSDGTLKCQTFNDVCLLLKSSDFVAHDLAEAYEHCSDGTQPHASDRFEMVLRKWIDIVPSMEFRCFVKNKCLAGISQRNHSTYYNFLQGEKERLFDSISNFFNVNLKDSFPDNNYVFDIYKSNSGKLLLLDFNPFGETTDALLFSWDELNDTDYRPDFSADELFRIVTTSDGIQPSPYLSYRLPKDTIDLSCGEDIQKMVDFLNLSSLVSRPSDTSDNT